MKCPQCGQQERIRVEITATAILLSGGKIVEKDDDWIIGENSWACCPACAHDGTVQDFDIWYESEEEDGQNAT